MNSYNEIKYMIDLVRNINESIESGKITINEAGNPLGLAAKEGRFGAKELKPIFDDLIKAGSSTEALLKKVGVKNSDDLFKLVTNEGLFEFFVNKLKSVDESVVLSEVVLNFKLCDKNLSILNLSKNVEKVLVVADDDVKLC